MPKVELSIPINPYIVSLPLLTDVHEIHFGTQLSRGIGLNSGPILQEWDGKPLIAQLGQEKISLAKVLVLGAVNIKFGVGADPTANTWAAVAADGYIELGFKHELANIWAVGNTSPSTFKIMVQTG